MLRNLNTKMFPWAKKYLQAASRRASQLLGVYSYVCINADPGNLLSDGVALTTQVSKDIEAVRVSVGHRLLR